MKVSAQLTLSPLVALLALGSANDSLAMPEVGIIYQLDRARFPGSVTVCTSRKLMDQYTEFARLRDEDARKKLIHKVQNDGDLERLKNSGGCVEISSFSQAKIVARGIESHQAEFASFPVFPLWGNYLYFGAKAR